MGRANEGSGGPHVCETGREEALKVASWHKAEDPQCADLRPVLAVRWYIAAAVPDDNRMNAAPSRMMVKSGSP